MYMSHFGIGIVQTKYGKLRGFEVATGENKGVTVFRGVPYAKPPVGSLRWKYPQEPESWTGVRDCFQFAPICPQIVEQSEPNGSDFNFAPLPAPMSEDCLYLDITTGAVKPGEKRPVFVWFHGGLLSFGYPSEPEFDGQALARKGVIVVSVGSRLNLFGYMCIPQLTAEQNGHSGNYGLMDQVMAIEWIRENIEAFGGDPNNITVDGQSGGAAKALAVALCPQMKGKIRNVIQQSGGKLTRAILKRSDAEKAWLQYLESIGLDPNMSLDELRALPTERITDNYSSKYQKCFFSGMYSNMVYDEIVAPYIINKDAVKAGALDGVNLMMGVCEGEAPIPHGKGLLAAKRQDSYNGDGTDISPEDLHADLKEFLGADYQKYNLDKLIDIKPGDDIWKMYKYIANLGLVPLRQATRCYTADRLTAMGMNKRAPNENIWCYMFGRIPPAQKSDIGTDRDPHRNLCYHAAELYYIFDSLRPGVPPTRNWDAYDYWLADLFSDYLVNFCKTGNPNGEDLPEWPSAASNGDYMYIGDTVIGKSGYSELELAALDYVAKQWDLDPNNF